MPKLWDCFRFKQAIGIAFFLLFADCASSQALTPAWVELGENGRALARIVVNGLQDCPAMQIDGISRAMSIRPNMPQGLRPVCELAIPANAKSASINARTLVLPKGDPARVIIIGDTGCRVLRGQIQNCNDPAHWPFRQVATAAATEKSDLILDVGDYLYRESPCPEASQTECGGSPAGDNWDAWNADFFAPAADLLRAAPWVFTRGNHESCNRAWRGWFYYLDPLPWDGKCEEYPAPYVMQLGKFQLAVVDSSANKDSMVDEAQVSTYAAQLASLHVKNAWLTTHHPFWGFFTAPIIGLPMPTSATLEEAWDKAAPKDFSLIISGHIHLFEYVSVDSGRPPQVVAGIGGTQMDVPIEASVKGTTIRGARVSGGRIREKFGYILMTKEGTYWNLELRDQQQKVLVSCTVPGSSESCQSVGSD